MGDLQVVYIIFRRRGDNRHGVFLAFGKDSPASYRFLVRERLRFIYGPIVHSTSQAAPAYGEQRQQDGAQRLRTVGGIFFFHRFSVPCIR